MARKQQEKSQQTQDELMAAAIELFGSQGFEATTVANITKRAGYAKGSFYRHWASKDELFLKIVERKLASYRQERDDRIGEASNLEEAMHVIWDFLETIIDDRDWSRIILEFTMHASRSETLREELNRGRYRLSNSLFAELVRNHVETGYPPEKLGALNTALFEGYLIQRAMGSETLNKKEVREAALVMALHYGTTK